MMAKNLLPTIGLCLFLAGISACMESSGRAPSIRLPAIEDAATSFEAATSLLDQGRVTEAITAFRALLRADGSSVRVLNGLAIAHGELGRPDLAAELFAKALAIAPDDPATHNNIGFAAFRRADVALARRYLQGANHLDGHDQKIKANLAVLAQLEAGVDGSLRRVKRQSDRRHPPLLALGRQTHTTLRLTGLQSPGEAPPTIHRPAVRPALSAPASMIDFTKLVDPWGAASVHPAANF